MAIYILLGPEEGEKNQWIMRERKKALDNHPDAECYSFFGGDEDESSFVSAISQSSLFSSFRFVVLKHFENIKKTDDMYKATVEFAKEPQDDVVFVVVSSESGTSTLPKELVQAAGKENTITFWEMRDDQKKSWIRETCRREGFQISQNAIEEILSSVDNNTQEMKNLVSSITTFLRVQNKGIRNIDTDDIEAYSARTKGENGYTLFRAIGEGDLEHALLIVQSIILNDSREVIPAVTVLANMFRRLENCLELKAARKSEDEIWKEATFIPTYAGGRRQVGINFKERDLYRKAMRLYTLEDVRRIIVYLGKSDSEVKSASTDMTKLYMETLVYRIIVQKGREPNLNFDGPSLDSTVF
ncbi:MAG: DNA polymerase III subunit delta [Spirochaetales bacterium]|nr:DNA polymerase III subunit delta [Candidatus Physcosoma equi]